MNKLLLFFVFTFCLNSFPYQDNNNGTITDLGTNLIWQKCSRGAIDTTTCSGTNISDSWSNSLQYCSSLNLGNKIWRLPNIRELKSILDYTKNTNPLINLSYFPNTESNIYWTSTTLVSSPTSVLNVSFYSGSSNNLAKLNNNYYARCVSGP